MSLYRITWETPSGIGCGAWFEAFDLPFLMRIIRTKNKHPESGLLRIEERPVPHAVRMMEEALAGSEP